MAVIGDLVENSRLLHQFNGSYTIHIIPDKNRNGEYSIQEWSRDGSAGEGSFGKVWREVLRSREPPRLDTQPRISSVQ
jgi:hypothetical protein